LFALRNRIQKGIEEKKHLPAQGKVLSPITLKGSARLICYYLIFKKKNKHKSVASKKLAEIPLVYGEPGTANPRRRSKIDGLVKSRKNPSPSMPACHCEARAGRGEGPPC